MAPEWLFILQNCPLHYRTFCIPLYLVCLLKMGGILQALGQAKVSPLFSNALPQRQQTPQYFVLWGLQGGPKGSVFSGLLCFFAWWSHLGLQCLNMRLELQSSTDHSPTWTRSLDCSSSRTPNTTDSVSFSSNPYSHLTSRFPCYPCFSGPETSFLPLPTLLPTLTCGRAIKACYFFAHGLFHMPCF